MAPSRKSCIKDLLLKTADQVCDFMTSADKKYYLKKTRKI